jgi:hypothetical protein
MEGMVDHLIEAVFSKKWTLIGRSWSHNQDGNLKALAPQLDAFFEQSNTQPGCPGLDEGAGHRESPVAISICLDHPHNLDVPHAIPDPTKIPGQGIQGHHGLGCPISHGMPSHCGHDTRTASFSQRRPYQTEIWRKTELFIEIRRKL